MANSEKEFLIRVRADIRDAITQMKRMGSETARTGKQAKSAAPEVNALGRTIGNLARGAAAYLSLRTAVRLLEVADSYNVLQQRIKTATKATGDYNQVSSQLYQLSRANGVALADTVSLFQNLARTAPELNATNEQMIELTNLVQQLGIIGGSTNAQLSAGLLQFSQGLAAGVFRAEEFNSIIENLPEVANRIAKGMGLTVGQLRGAVIEGKVLSKDVFNSLLSQSGEIGTEFENIPTSMQRAGESLTASISRFVGLVDQQVRATERAVSALEASAGFVDTVSDQLDTESLDAQIRTLERLHEELETVMSGGNTGAPFAGFMGWYSDLLGIGEQYDDSAIKALLADINEVNARIEALRESASSGGGEDSGGIINTPAINENREAIDKLIESLSTQAETLGQTKDAVSLYKLELLGATEEELKLAQAHIDTIAAFEEQQRVMEAGQRIYEATRTEAERLAAELAELDRLYQQGAFGAVGSAQALDTYSRAIFNAIETQETFVAAGEDQFDRLEAAVRGWGEEFTNTLADMVLEGKASFKDLANSIIRELLKIMIYQTIVGPALGAMGFSGFGATGATAFHSGGIVGAGGSPRQISPFAFVNAPRYHDGGFAGLRHDEVPAVLQRGEEVLTRNDPRHALNQGGTSSEVRVELINKGTPSQAQQANSRFDGGAMVISIVLDDLNRGGSIANSLDKRYKGRGSTSG